MGLIKILILKKVISDLMKGTTIMRMFSCSSTPVSMF